MNDNNDNVVDDDDDVKHSKQVLTISARHPHRNPTQANTKKKFNFNFNFKIDPTKKNHYICTLVSVSILEFLTTIPQKNS